MRGHHRQQIYIYLSNKISRYTDIQTEPLQQSNLLKLNNCVGYQMMLLTYMLSFVTHLQKEELVDAAIVQQKIQDLINSQG